MTDKYQEVNNEKPPSTICHAVRDRIYPGVGNKLFHGRSTMGAFLYIPSPHIGFRVRNDPHVLETH